MEVGRHIVAGSTASGPIRSGMESSPLSPKRGKPLRRIIHAAAHIAGRVSGKSAVGPGRNRLQDETHAAITEEKVASTRVQAAEAADIISASAVVPVRVPAEHGRTHQSAVHGLITWIGRITVLRGYCEN